MSFHLLTNKNGLEIRVCAYGGTIQSIRVPDRAGAFADVVLGMDTVEAYRAGTPYFGCIVGRYANRIAGARFTIEDVSHALLANEGPNQLHGGPNGFDAVDWALEPFKTATSEGVHLSHTSPDGDQGFPGTLSVNGTYELNDDNTLTITFQGETDKPTHVNLSHHSYFNLAGVGAGDILGHELMVCADAYTPVDENSIPTGEIKSLEGSAFDFRSRAAIGPRLAMEDAQLTIAGGLDHNFVLRPGGGDVLRLAAELHHRPSGRTLTVRTMEPGLQVYTGNGLDGTLAGKGTRFERHAGICLEPQHFPDTPNKPHFPSTLLRPGEVYRTQSEFAFGVDTS